jgi:hypothetical protein
VGIGDELEGELPITGRSILRQKKTQKYPTDHSKTLSWAAGQPTGPHKYFWRSLAVSWGLLAQIQPLGGGFFSDQCDWPRQAWGTTTGLDDPWVDFWGAQGPTTHLDGVFEPNQPPSNQIMTICVAQPQLSDNA